MSPMLRIIVVFFIVIAGFGSPAPSSVSSESVQPVPAKQNSPAVVQVVAGDGPTCALINGLLECWGNYSLAGNSFAIRVPELITGLNSSVLQAVTFGNTLCVIVTNGRVLCWGDNQYGQVGNNTTSQTSSPAQVTGLTSGVMQIAAGRYHVCALLSNQTVKCWGWGQFGQMGNNTSLDVNKVPVQVSGVSGAVKIVSGSLRTCALLNTGRIKCWGGDYEDWDNNGLFNTEWNYSIWRTPYELQHWTAGVTDLTIGDNFMCVVINGGAECWGPNGLADGTASPDPDPTVDPVPVEGLSTGVTEIKTGSLFMAGVCAKKDGALYCWGDNSTGRVGDGTFENRYVPVRVKELPDSIDSFGLANEHACASSGTNVYCWGSNANNNLADGTVYFLTKPSLLDVSGSITSITGGMDNTCAAVNGAAWCWGGSNYFARPPTIQPGFETGVTHVTIGYPNFCALKDGAVYCDGNWMPMAGLESGVTQLVAGHSFTCAIKNGGAFCWGNNHAGQIGNGSAETIFFDPQPVTGLSSGVTDIFAMHHNACAVQAGKVKCWGGGEYTPVEVAGLSNVTKTGISCAISTGELYCWTRSGSNFTITKKAGLTNQVTALEQGYGGGNICVIDGGALKCWGIYNEFGQLGSGGTAPVALPTIVAGMESGVTLVEMGWNHTCAAKGSQLFCWGDNRLAQVGDNNPVMRPIPVPVVGLIHTQPDLTINYDEGQHGSIFRLVGVRFPPHAQIIVSVNGVFVGEAIVEPDGTFFLLVNTYEAEDGIYQVLVRAVSTGNEKQDASLDENAYTGLQQTIQIAAHQPLRLREGSGSRITLGDGVAPLIPTVFLPVLSR